MKLTWIVILAFAVLLVLFGVFLNESCSGNESLTSIDKALAQRDTNLAKLETKMGQIDSAIKALRIEKNEIKNYYTNKYYEIDSLANLDSLLLYSIIRARTDRLYRLPGFFSFAIRDSGAGKNSKDSSSW